MLQNIVFAKKSGKKKQNNVSPDYFVDHLQVSERQKFFSIFYMSINAGSLLSTVITPILRGENSQSWCSTHEPNEVHYVTNITVLMLVMLDLLLQVMCSVLVVIAMLWPLGFLQL